MKAEGLTRPYILGDSVLVVALTDSVITYIKKVYLRLTDTKLNTGKIILKTLIDFSTEIFDIKDLLHDVAEGDTIASNGCTFNANRDTDKLCFKNAAERFLKSGSKQDAFDIFFCYSEIFKPFGGYKDGIDKLLELMYQHESNSANLLMKHRDHYSHCAYVFALGIALYMHNENMRNTFNARYGEDKPYENFLSYWGLAALFHDIGYPYEISYQQVLQYGKKINTKKESALKFRYTNIQGFAALTNAQVRKCGKFMPHGGKDVNTLFASRIEETFGKGDVESVKNLLINTVAEAEDYIDHGYFGAVLLIKKLLQTSDFELTEPILDAVIAILLHNSFYKFSFKKFIGEAEYEQVSLNTQPLAYLLMLCDELQCWDRTAYGELSKKQEAAWDFDISFSESTIDLTYYFEASGESTLKMQKLISDIDKKVVSTNELAKFTVKTEIKKKDKRVYDCFSDDRFINLCKIAETININYNKDCKKAGNKKYLQQQFDELTLEYKLSNIGQAKQYAKHLDEIKCFYSDKRYDYPVVRKFTPEEVRYLALREHIRWVNEKVSMGWKYGELTDVITDEATQYTKATRASKRMHEDIVPYEMLEQQEKNKDVNPIQNMIGNLDKYGIRIYRLVTDKPKYAVGCTGHINLLRISNFAEREEDLRTAINAYLSELKEKYDLKLYSGLANGADSIFAEEALKCGINVVAVLPNDWKAFMQEQKNQAKFMQLFGASSEVKLCLNGYEGVMNKIISDCSEILTLWDGVQLPLFDENKKEINRGGTYDTIRNAKLEGKKIKSFN